MKTDKNKSFILTIILILVTLQALLVIIIKLNRYENSRENYKGNTYEAVTRAAISSTVRALEKFKLDMGEYPYPAKPIEEGKGLLALVNKDKVDLGMSGKSLRTKDAPELTKWRGPYLKTTRLPDGSRDVPKDGWNRPLVYEKDGKGGFILISKGANPNDETDDIIETSKQ